MGCIVNFLSFKDVYKEFSTDRGAMHISVIENVSIDIEEGSVTAFLGPSGCGKTTLMRIAGGLETLTSGSVQLQGEEVVKPDRRKGMVFQSYSSFPWLTVEGNVRFGTRYRNDINESEKDEVVKHYLSLVRLSEYASLYPTRISGGMRQRVAIARTLAAGPSLLLMDEPFGALDAQTRESLQFQLLDINRQERKTIIFVTHDVEEAILLADRIIMFSSRPARIIREIDVNQLIHDEPRGPETKESEPFFKLRNEVLHIARNQGQSRVV